MPKVTVYDLLLRPDPTPSPESITIIFLQKLNVSVIIPTLNESKVLEHTLSEIQACEPFEIIVSDGGSEDDTRDIAGKFPVRFLDSSRGRACQMNAGSDEAKGDVLVFLHADSRLTPNGFRKMVTVMNDPQWAGGAFSLSIDSPGTPLRLISFFANLRSRWFHLVYGDQGIFVRAQVFKSLGGYAPLPICEDLEFFQRLKQHGPVKILNEKTSTSARRWHSEGIVFTTSRNIVIALAFLLGFSPKRLSQWYPPRR